MQNKQRTLVLIALILIKGIIFLSCSTTQNIQVMETESNDVSFKDGKYAYENDDIQLSYDFWQNAPNMYFTIFNKTNKPLYVDFGRSHLILNGQSFDYYQDLEEISSVSTSSKTASYYANTGYGHSNMIQTQNTKIFKPKRIVEIPPKSLIAFIDYHTNISYNVDNCELVYLKNKQPYTSSFEENNSPFKMRNYLTYSKDDNLQNPLVAENHFWVSKISVMTQYDFKTATKCYDCLGNGIQGSMFIYPYQNPKNIYYEFKHNPKLYFTENPKKAKR